ncbi:class III poly(R)-hydroxyalkanoic acid synthase subunit PhaE [Stenotrophomonas sp. 278]|uniref:class III poly(R)-hydroxyalkanoic acid synthase subunit PhaE n=1 Tax=Stenotrophomonas sp. 278 TaxID=2479851 RepID=UPI000F685B1A|nr:class III poly(R)-hydroxyalkanoic acid synthase subunit PhaE [Stenotrophomonas sp. 278]RRU10148.1 class III poly(R)-hydroxyalkanoic acid synthase subunit PhaE [Stenotrophomonas sp. 278]
MSSSAGGPHDAGDFEALARQYFSAWGDALRHAASTGGVEGGHAPGSWQQTIEGWAQLMSAPGAAPGNRQADEAVHRFREQAGGWYGTMQAVAARFAGQDASSADIAQAWREAVEGQGGGMLKWMLQGARGHTQSGGPDLLAMLERLQKELEPWLQSPAFGPAREHQARWQGLLRAQQDYQAHARAYVEQIQQALDDAHALFEQRLSEHEQPGNQLTSARAMFDLWIEVAEEAYAKVALSEPFQQVYASLGNAQMRLRGAAQHEVERLCEALGLPTRTEMDAAHRRITELERLVRRMAAAQNPAPDSKARAKPRPKPGPTSRSTAKSKRDAKSTASVERRPASLRGAGSTTRRKPTP